MIDQLLALRLEGLDGLDLTFVVVDSLKIIGWIVLTLGGIAGGLLLLAAIKANPAVGAVIILLLIARRRPRHAANVGEYEADFFAVCGAVLSVAGWLLLRFGAINFAYLMLAVALMACGVWMTRSALLERYMARHGGAAPPTLRELLEQNHAP